VAGGKIRFSNEATWRVSESRMKEWCGVGILALWKEKERHLWKGKNPPRKEERTDLRWEKIVFRKMGFGVLKKDHQTVYVETYEDR